MSKCLLCGHSHSAMNGDPLSCGICKACGMLLCKKRLTANIAGKAYAFCCENCSKAYKRTSTVMRKRFLLGEVSEKDIQDFENNILI